MSKKQKPSETSFEALTEGCMYNWGSVPNKKKTVENCLEAVKYYSSYLEDVPDKLKTPKIICISPMSPFWRPFPT